MTLIVVKYRPSISKPSIDATTGVNMLLDSLTQLHSRLTHPAFVALQHQIDLAELTAWPDSRVLNDIASAPMRFIDDPIMGSPEQVQLTQLGYEGFIDATSSIPTRRNWHDVFNACIWHQFPRCKQRLNQLHIQYINAFGAKPRGLLRDRITHFDECGVILAYTLPPQSTGSCQQSSPFIPDLLTQHAWHAAFVEQRAQWGAKIHPYVFGHANLEMLLDPHIGLTAKWIGVAVPDGFFAQHPRLQTNLLDAILAKQLDPEFFAQKLKPLPILGIPAWWPNQNSDFYADTAYFRPKRATESRK